VEIPECMKIPISLDDPLGALHQLADIIGDKLVEVSWNSVVFGRDIYIPLYLHKQYVLMLALGSEELKYYPYSVMDDLSI